MFKSYKEGFRQAVGLILMLSVLSLSACFFKTSPETDVQGDGMAQSDGDGAPGEEAISELEVGQLEPLEEVPPEIPEGVHTLRMGTNFKVPVSDLPVEVNSKVLSWMEYFTTRGRPIFEKWLERQPLVEAMITRVLKEYALPQDLLYLSMIESGFNPKAYSHARASGPWQFMRGTAKLYGLSVDAWVDERRDLEKATDAAARHLRDLYDHFGDWNLAAAAYNAGTGKVERAIRRHKTRDYWSLASVRRPYLRAETRNYVPKLYAALIIAKQPEVFGFVPILPSLEKPYEVAIVEDAVDLYVVARCAGVDIEEVKALNPELRLWFTPPDPSYGVRLPYGTKDTFLTNFEKIPDEERVTFRQHILRRGETLSSLARHYHTTTQAIMQLNKLSSPKRIRLGRSLVIPIRPGENFPDEGRGKWIAEEDDRPRHRKYRNRRGSRKIQPGPAPKGTKPVRHVVQSGDTLWALSQKYNVSTRAIRNWNSLRQSRIYPGEVLTIYVKGS